MRRLILSFTALSLALSLPYFAVRSQEEIEVGYAILEVEGGQRPTAAALFSFTNADGILVWEAGVEAVEEISRGRLFVDQSGQTRTAIALVNASDEAVEAGLVLRDADGLEVDRKTEVFAAGEHHSLFVDELFDDPPETGSLTFEAVDGGSLAAVTLRQNTNQHGEAIFAALPAADLDAAPAQDLIVFPQVGAGSGLSTQIILIDTSGAGSSGMIALTASDGEPLEAEVGGQMTSEIPFQIEADGVFRTELSSPVGVRTGYAVVTADEGSALPDGAAIFQFRFGDAVITEAGVAAARGTTRARMYVDNHRTRTGVALASPTNPATDAAYRLLDRFNQELSATSRPIGASGHLPIFADELFAEMPAGFTGLLEFESDVPLVPVSLKLTINARGEPVLTTLPVADAFSATEAQSAQRGQAETRRLIFPQLGFGAGLATRLIVIHPDEETEASATLSFRRTLTGEALDLLLGDRFGSDFDLSLSGVGGIDLRPGNTAQVAAIRLDTFNPEFSEVVVDQGSTLQLRPRVIDSEGNPRDDFRLNFFNLDAEVANVSLEGVVAGLEKGFSTLRISAGGVELQGLLTVVEVIQGIDIGETTGIVRDLAGRIYLSSETEHVIWRADSIDSPPVLFAGIRGEAGFANGEHLQARFDRPSFLALNQGTGDLYVADSGNHVIRIVRTNGRVETLAGTGTPGSQDGPALEAGFRNPQGVALDNRGHLWVSDSGNHTIRRIDLVSGQVETIAGVPGLSGQADGEGISARLDNPMGIALEAAFTDSLEGPQAVSLVVADSGNGIIRRVFEDGRVVTITSSGVAPGGRTRGQATAPLSFLSPSGIAVDTSGAIYLTESEIGRGKVIESDGSVIPLSQSQTGIKGVWTTGGRALLSGKISSSSLSLGSPTIVSITPESVRFEGGETVTIRGRNFTPDTFLVLGSQVLTDIDFQDSQTIVFQVPAADSGLQTLSTLTRGGLAQDRLGLTPAPLDELEPGFITTVAGGSSFSGDGQFAKDSLVFQPADIAVDSAGNVFLAEKFLSRVRRIDAATGLISTVAGIGVSGFSGDGGPAIAAALSEPEGIAFDEAGNLLIADSANHRIRRVDAQTGVITTIAGNGERGFNGSGRALDASFDFPRDVFVDTVGEIYIADSFNHRIRKIDLNGDIITVVGSGCDAFFPAPQCPLGDNGPALGAGLADPRGVAIDKEGNIFVADKNNCRIRRVDKEGQITTFAGTGQCGDAMAELDNPERVVVDSAGNLFIADTQNDRIQKIDMNGEITTVLESLSGPRGLEADGSEILWIADTFSDSVVRLLPSGEVGTVVGDREPEDFLGDEGPATEASLAEPDGITVDEEGVLYIADVGNNRIRKVESGLITTVVSGLSAPRGVTSEGPALILVSDTFNHQVKRLVRRADGTYASEVLAGKCDLIFDAACSLGDGGLATDAGLGEPVGLAIFSSSAVFIADRADHRVRRVDGLGIISTEAGNGVPGFDDQDDGGPAAQASLNQPQGLVVDSSGNLYMPTHSTTGFVVLTRRPRSSQRWQALENVDSLVTGDPPR